MQNLERRITALESQADSEGGSLTVRLVRVEAGEASEQAITRAGYDPDAPGMFYVCMVPMARGGPQVSD